MDDIAKIAALAESLNAATALIVAISKPAITPPVPLDWTAIDTAVTTLNTAITDLQARLAQEFL